MSRVGFIGTGHIAAPMARFLAAKGHDIHVTRRNVTMSSALHRDIGAEVGDPQSVVDASDIVFLCLRPQIAADVIAPLTFREGQKIVSVMAGVTRDTLDRLCAPATSIVQTIPLGYLEQGGCPLAAFGHAEVLAALFEPENPVVAVASEDALNAHFTICALVPGLLDLMNTGADWLGQVSRDPGRAEFYVTQLVSGFLSAMDKSAPGALARERDALATDGTLSLMMTDGLKRGGAHDALGQTFGEISAKLEAPS
jgi:pyrroline-5-carboxylate reductase